MFVVGVTPDELDIRVVCSVRRAGVVVVSRTRWRSATLRPMKEWRPCGSAEDTGDACVRCRAVTGTQPTNAEVAMSGVEGRLAWVGAVRA